MITDILNKPLKLDIEGNCYNLEFDNKAYGMLEQEISKGIFQIYDAVIESTLNLEQYISIVTCGLLKHHKEQEIKEIKSQLEQKPYLVIQNIPSICGAYLAPLTPPEIMQQALKKEGSKKK